jgi:hypothetical protein
MTPTRNPRDTDAMKVDSAPPLRQHDADGNVVWEGYPPEEEDGMYEPESGPVECSGCGAGEDALSIYSPLLGQAWCCTACRNGQGCDCQEEYP